MTCRQARHQLISKTLQLAYEIVAKNVQAQIEPAMPTIGSQSLRYDREIYVKHAQNMYERITYTLCDV